MSKQKNIQIQISGNLKKSLEKKTNELGLGPVNNVILMILQNFVSGQFDTSFVEIADPETEKRIGEALADIERGDYIVVDPREEGFLEKALNAFEDD